MSSRKQGILQLSELYCEVVTKVKYASNKARGQTSDECCRDRLDGANKYKIYYANASVEVKSNDTKTVKKMRN